MINSIASTTNRQPVRCIHGMLPGQCAVCNPPEGPRAKAIGCRSRGAGSSGRGVAPIYGDTRPMFDRPISKEMINGFFAAV